MASIISDKVEPVELAEPPSGLPSVVEALPGRKPPTLKHNRINYDTRVLLLALVSGLPGVFISLWLIWRGDYTIKSQWTLTVLILGVWLGFAFGLRDKVIRPLQTLANLLAALREGDYSIRARGASRADTLSEVMLEINALGEPLREQRLGALEATALLRRVMAEIDVAIFAFDGEQRLRLVNRAGEKLLAQPGERLIGRHAQDLDLLAALEGEEGRILQTTFPGRAGRWEVRRSIFRQGGLAHQLLVLSDLSQALREEERQAWQRLIRVLGHELNNSLAPIKSIAGSLERIVSREILPDDWQEDMQRGLTVIASRAESLSRFTNAYARLARLPQPRLTPIEIAPLLRRVVGLETRWKVDLLNGPSLMIRADNDQLEQLMINLIRNAVDAAMETDGAARVGWRRVKNFIEIIVEDEGPGLSNTTNLFVPFFTTKPAGSGIGLVLCRQIAEAHGGALTLENRPTGSGCEAKLRLPL